MKFKKSDFDFYFTDNKKDKMKRTSREFFSFIANFIFGIVFLFLFYVLYICAYACM